MKQVWIKMGAVLGFAVLLTGIALAGHHKKLPQRAATQAVSKVTLERKNTLVLRNVITEDSIKDVQQAALTMSTQLSNNDTIYLFLDSPGGSISAGEQLITTLKGLPQTVTTITNFGASMAFITAQSLGERLILPTGTLMSHRAFMGLEGQVPGEYNTRSNFFQDDILEVEKVCANRMNMNIKDYQSMIEHEYWVSGAKAVASNAADKVVLATCAADLQGTTMSKIMTFFGPIKITYSDCPLVSSPLSVDFSEMNTYGEDTLEVSKVKRLVYESITDRKIFVKDSSFRENYFKYVH